MKRSYTFRLTDSTNEYLERVAAESGKTKTQALEHIILLHKTNADEPSLIADAVVERIEEKYKNLFTRMRLSTNFTDRNVQIIIEMMNTLAFALNVKNAFTTNISKSPVIQDCEDEVKRRIAQYKQHNDNKTK